MQKNRFISLVMIAFFLLPSYASGQGKTDITLAIVPLSDGNADEYSRSISETMANVISINPGTPFNIHVIEPTLASSVSTYTNGGDEISETSKEATSLLTQAKDAYFSFQYKEADRLTNQAIQILKDSRYGDLLIDAHLTKAIISKAKGNAVDTAKNISLALSINPRLKLANDSYPPSIMSVYNDERTKMLKGSTGSISVETTPPAASIYLNGTYQATSPSIIDGLPAGVYKLTLQANRYQEVNHTVAVEPDKMASIKSKLKWSTTKKSGSSVHTTDPTQNIAKAIAIGKTTGSDKVVLINVDEKQFGKKVINSQMIDVKYEAPYKPLLIKAMSDIDSILPRLADAIISQSREDISTDIASREPSGMGKAEILTRKRTYLHKSPVFWGVIGGVLAAALGGGLAITLGRSGNSSDVGQLHIQLKSEGR